jgi:hypothetical protein
MSLPSLFRGPDLHLGKRASNARRLFGSVSPPSHPAQHRLAGKEAKRRNPHNIANFATFL